MSYLNSPSLPFFYSLPTIPGKGSTGIIFFLYIHVYTILTPTPFPHLLPPPTGTNPLPQAEFILPSYYPNL
jgi:hypothetical protein